MPMRRLAMLIASLLAATSCFAQHPDVALRQDTAWRETARLPALEAHQAAAADEQHVYAIGSREIGKYDRQTGKRVATSTPAATHLNSGFWWRGKLYCAHSNFPATPERSEILVLDPATMRLTEFRSFVNQPGSLTWAVRHNGAWWCNFAFYGAENYKSYLARFHDDWKEQGRWTYPQALVTQLGRHSLSGGLWYQGDLLATDHDNPVIYRLKAPTDGDVLELVGLAKSPFPGQGIAYDPLGGGLVGIDRKKQSVIFATRSGDPVR